MNIQVSDIYRLKVDERQRVWQVVGIFLGATGQEDLVGLMSIDLNSGSAYGKRQDILLVPQAIFIAAALERC
jgi:hypothetical protein